MLLPLLEGKIMYAKGPRNHFFRTTEIRLTGTTGEILFLNGLRKAYGDSNLHNDVHRNDMHLLMVFRYYLK
jgi:hypothetical protein